MELDVHHYPVNSLAWGDVNDYDDGTLLINREEMLGYLKEQGELDEVSVTQLSLIVPGTSTRVINIFDVCPAHARLEKKSQYPGLLGKMEQVGSGKSAQLQNFSILMLAYEENRNTKLLDMSGVGATMTPYSSMYHLAIQVKPHDDKLPEADYHYRLKRIGLQVGVFLARIAARKTPVSIKRYELLPPKMKLPRVAYAFMICSHQKSEKNEPILYGDDVSGLLPTILHPNEILDGAAVAPYWNLGIDTYSFQQNPIVKQLYERHGKEIDFVGVIVYVAHVQHVKRSRTVMMVTNLAKHVLNIDLAVVSKLGGGIPESDLLMIVEQLERQGIQTTAPIWASTGDGTFNDSLSTNTEAADALTSVGIYDDEIELPKVSEVIGTDNLTGPYHSETKVYTFKICGAINQLGGSQVTMVEI